MPLAHLDGSRRGGLAASKEALLQDFLVWLPASQWVADCLPLKGAQPPFWASPAPLDQPTGGGGTEQASIPSLRGSELQTARN